MLRGKRTGRVPSAWPLLLAVAVAVALTLAPPGTAAQDTPAPTDDAPPDESAPSDPDAAVAPGGEDAADAPVPADETDRALGAPGADDAAVTRGRRRPPVAIMPDAAPLDALPAGDAPGEAPAIRYLLERVRIEGIARSARHAVLGFVHLRPGDVLDVDDPDLEAVRWRLLGTGWFQDVTLRLERGSVRGRVVLVVRVSERNTLVLRQVAFGVAQNVERTGDPSPQIDPYLGLSVADRNLFGQGLELGVSALVSAPQWGVHLDLTDPFLLGSRFAGHLDVFVNDAREFFGENPRVGAGGDAENVVVPYRRIGLRLGTGVDVSRYTRVTAGYQLEHLRVANLPDWASSLVGDEVRPLDFAVLDGTSVVSFLDVGLRYERRDDPVLPASGTLVDVRGWLSSRVLGSNYEFLRLGLLFRQWIPLPWRHHVRVGVFGGIVFGTAPFYLQFYAADLSDLIPARVLEMNVDRRPAPNFFGTAIGEARTEEVAGRVDLEYGVPLVRASRGPVRRVDAYVGVGLYALTDRDGLRVALPGYEGASRLPVDLTFDAGLRIDSDVGVLQLGLSTVLGFVQP